MALELVVDFFLPLFVDENTAFLVDVTASCFELRECTRSVHWKWAK